MTLHDDIRGGWELVSYATQDDRGGPVTFPLGPDAVGLIMYTQDGYMSAQLMRPDRPDYDQPDTAGGTDAQHAAAAAGYLAYVVAPTLLTRPLASFTTKSSFRCCQTGWEPCNYATAVSHRTGSR
jgi:hypothetical protein